MNSDRGRRTELPRSDGDCNKSSQDFDRMAKALVAHDPDRQKLQEIIHAITKDEVRKS